MLLILKPHYSALLFATVYFDLNLPKKIVFCMLFPLILNSNLVTLKPARIYAE